MDEKVDAMDRISVLPSFIIHEIMSYLSAKEVAKTSILSKKWNHLRKSFPRLVFLNSDFLRLRLSHGIKKYYSEEVYLRKIMKFVDISLIRFCQLNFCIQEFRLSISLSNVQESTIKKAFSTVDRWIGLVVENGVKEFDVNVTTAVDQNAIYTLPQKLFSAKSLTTLKLSCFKILEQPSDTITLPSLKKLSLHDVYINEHMLQNLISQCPLLEGLLLKFCWGMKHLCVSNAFKLKIFEIEEAFTKPEDKVTGVEIAIPSLQRFKLALSGSRSEQRPFVIDIAGCPYLKNLRVGACRVDRSRISSPCPRISLA